MKHIPWKTALGTALSVGLIAAPLAAVPAFAVEVSPAAGTSPVIINEAYLSGGSAGAAFKNKFVELYNTSDAPVSLDGWSLQYRSATGTAAPSFGRSPDRQHPGQGLLPAQGRQPTAAPPAPDTARRRRHRHRVQPRPARAEPSSWPSRPPRSTRWPTGSVIEPSNVADLLGYGTSNTFETQAATAPTGNTRRQEPEPQQRC